MPELLIPFPAFPRGSPGHFRIISVSKKKDSTVFCAGQQSRWSTGCLALSQEVIYKAEYKSFWVFREFVDQHSYFTDMLGWECQIKYNCVKSIFTYVIISSFYAKYHRTVLIGLWTAGEIQRWMQIIKYIYSFSSFKTWTKLHKYRIKSRFTNNEDKPQLCQPQFDMWQPRPWDHWNSRDFQKWKVIHFQNSV